MNHLERRHVITLAGPVHRVFPLFTPRGEELWVPGWSPEYLHPASGETQAGMVFRTGAGEELALWSCLDWQPEAWRVRYARVTPASRFGFVEVVCREAPGGRTQASVSYRFTALNAAGEAYLDGLTEEAFTAMVEDWQVKIDAWLARGETGGE